MERDAERFFAELPDFDRRIGSRQEHLRVVIETVGSLLDRRPDFLRILVVMAFVARQAHPELTIAELLEHLPAALAAVRRELGRSPRLRTVI